MDSLQYSDKAFGLFSLFIMTLTITLYFLLRKKKLRQTWLLIGFFTCITLMFLGFFLGEILSEYFQTYANRAVSMLFFSMSFLIPVSVTSGLNIEHKLEKKRTFTNETIKLQNNYS